MFVDVTLSLLEGFGKTIEIFLLTLLFSLPLGLVISFGSMSKFRPLRSVVRVFVWIIRGTPLMLQLITIFFVPGFIGRWAEDVAASEALINSIVSFPLFGNVVSWHIYIPADNFLINFLATFHVPDRFFAVMVAFVINYSCYFSEIYRGGIESMPRGQYEAGAVLGMTKSQTFFKVILFQVVKKIVPPMSNEIITLVKDTSLARVISVYEIIWAAQKFAKTDGLVWPLFYTGAFYLIFSGALTILFGFIEKKMNYYRE